MAFELHNLKCTLISVTPRVEKHGDGSVPAISLALKITTANTILDKLSPTLRHRLYKSAEEDGQPSLEEVGSATTVLRVTDIEIIKLKGELAGWTMQIEYGIDDADPIKLGACKVDHFAVTPHQGGTVDLFLRIGTSDVTPEDAGILWSKNGREITFSLTAPAMEVAEQQPLTDGGAPLFEQKTPEDAIAETQP